MAAGQEIADEMIALCRQAAEANRACAARQGNVIALDEANADELMIAVSYTHLTLPTILRV